MTSSYNLNVRFMHLSAPPLQRTVREETENSWRQRPMATPPNDDTAQLCPWQQWLQRLQVAAVARSGEAWRGAMTG